MERARTLNPSITNKWFFRHVDGRRWNLTLEGCEEKLSASLNEGRSVQWPLKEQTTESPYCHPGWAIVFGLVLPETCLWQCKILTLFYYTHWYCSSSCFTQSQAKSSGLEEKKHYEYCHFHTHLHCTCSGSVTSDMNHLFLFTINS